MPPAGGYQRVSRRQARLETSHCSWGREKAYDSVELKVAKRVVPETI